MFFFYLRLPIFGKIRCSSVFMNFVIFGQIECVLQCSYFYELRGEFNKFPDFFGTGI